MANAYADEDALEAWLPAAATLPDGDVERLLIRASELLDDTVRRPFGIDDDGIPTDTDIATALADACCAQVEFWLEVGEEHDLAGLAGAGVGISQLHLDRLPPEVAPRAKRILHTAGLLSSGASPTFGAAFFATQSGT